MADPRHPVIPPEVSLVFYSYNFGGIQIDTFSLSTLPETNMAPENGWLEDAFPIEMVPFQVLC